MVFVSWPLSLPGVPIISDEELGRISESELASRDGPVLAATLLHVFGRLEDVAVF